MALYANIKGALLKYNNMIVLSEIKLPKIFKPTLRW